MKKKTVVLGLGESGIAAAEFLLQQKKEVIGIDKKAASLHSAEQKLGSKGLRCQQETDPLLWEEVECLVVSPGISPKHPIYHTAIEKGIKVVGEAELALPHFTKPLVAVTGTNGKTTVTLLVEHILNASGIKAKALGNVGTALCSYLLQPMQHDAFVVELSSFQLETMQTPVFEAAVLLNVTPDHLDRYASMEDYARAKFHLGSLLKKEGSFFLLKQTAEEFGHLFSEREAQTFDSEGLLGEKRELLIPKEYIHKGKHDQENAIAAWALCQPLGVTREQFRTALLTFCKPPHRIEFVREWNGIFFYDDSKGTNIDAVIQAVKAMPGPVILIAGGVDKGASYLPWKEHFLGKVKQIITIGQAAEKIYGELHPYFNIKRADSLRAAVDAAAQGAERGDYILLSPGCSSYDMFRDYAHRGEEFQRLVKIIE